MRLIFLIALAAGISSPSSGQKPEPKTECTMHATHTQMNERGEEGMGFSQTATTHHFFLSATGGSIQVEANNASDAVNRDNIRLHLGHIAQAFQNGDFDIPMFVHTTVPPGVSEMKRLRKQIRYSFEETPTGGRVVITSTDKDALNAVHRFLRFQIEEHKTGDSVELH